MHNVWSSRWDFERNFAWPSSLDWVSKIIDSFPSFQNIYLIIDNFLVWLEGHWKLRWSFLNTNLDMDHDYRF